MPDLEVSLEVSLQLYVLEFIGIVYLEELQLGSLLKLDLVILGPVIWESLYMLYVERRVSLVLRWDLSRLSVRFCVFVVRKLVASGRSERYFGDSIGVSI